MADYTTNLNLKKPAQSDFYDIDDQNDNMDIIDTAITAREYLAPIGMIRTCSSPSLQDENYLQCDGGVLVSTDYPQMAGLLRAGTGTWTDYGDLYLAPSDDSVIYDVAYGNDMVLLLTTYGSSSNYGTAWRMTAPQVWEGEGNNLFRRQSAVVFAEDKFVTVGYYGTSYYTKDGVNWTAMTGMSEENSSGDTTNMSDVDYGNGRWVAVGYYGAVYYSTNGTSWSSYNGFSNSTHLVSVAYGNGKFVAVGNSGVSYYSTTGASWTAMSGIDASHSLSAVVYGNGRWVAVGSSGAAYYSTNGTSWTSMSGLSSSSYSTVTYGNGVYMAVAYNNLNMYQSTNGTSWSLRDTLDSDETPRAARVAFLNGRFHWFYNSWGYDVCHAVMVPTGYYELPWQKDTVNQLYGYVKVTDN